MGGGAQEIRGGHKEDMEGHREWEGHMLGGGCIVGGVTDRGGVPYLWGGYGGRWGESLHLSGGV